VGDVHAYVREVYPLLSAETARVPDIWSESNPCIGHADVLSVIIAENFGGLIFQGLSDEVGVHFWNKLPDNRFDACIYNGMFEDQPKWKFTRKIPMKAMVCDVDIKRRLKILREKLDIPSVNQYTLCG